MSRAGSGPGWRLVRGGRVPGQRGDVVTAPGVIAGGGAGVLLGADSGQFVLDAVADGRGGVQGLKAAGELVSVPA